MIAHTNSTAPTAERQDRGGPHDAVDLTPPKDLEAERACLGCMLLGGDTLREGLGVLQAADFSESGHAGLFRFLGELANAMEPEEPALDVLRLDAALRTAAPDVFEKIGGRGGIVDLYESMPGVASFPFYARIVRGLAARRRAMHTALEFLRTVALDPRADPAGLWAEAGAGIRSVRRAEPMTAAALCAKYPAQREPVIDGLLRRGEVGSIISAPKMFKSWFLLYVALAVATGHQVFGFKTRPGRVLLLDYELAGGTLAKRLQAVAGAMDIPLDDLGRLATEPLRGKRLDVHGLAAYFGGIAPRRYDLVIVDPLYRIYPPEFDENSNAAMAEVFAALQGYAERLDAGLLVVHHLTKGDQSFKSVTDLGAGGGSQARAADVHLAMRRHSEDGAAVLSGVVRSFAPFNAVALRWEYPLWHLAPDLDPTDLARAPRRGGAKTLTGPPAPAVPGYDVSRFVAEFIKPEPMPSATIIEAAKAAGLTKNRAEDLLHAGEGGGQVHRWKYGPAVPVRFATVPQTLLGRDGKTPDESARERENPPHTPHGA